MHMPIYGLTSKHTPKCSSYSRMRDLRSIQSRLFGLSQDQVRQIIQILDGAQPMKPASSAEKDHEQCLNRAKVMSLLTTLCQEIEKSIQQRNQLRLYVNLSRHQQCKEKSCWICSGEVGQLVKLLFKLDEISSLSKKIQPIMQASLRGSAPCLVMKNGSVIHSVKSKLKVRSLTRAGTDGSANLKRRKNDES